MPGVNKVILIGNLGRDPEIRFMPNGTAVTTLNVATSSSRTDKNTGEIITYTEWHKVVLYNRLAEIAGEYLRKGSKVYIEGSLRTRKWQDNSGQNRQATEIAARQLQMLSGIQGSQAQSMQQPPAGKQEPQQHIGSYQAFDDDIPF